MKIQTKALTLIALMTAVTCILGPLSIPIGPVPISFTNLAIFFTVYMLGMTQGSISYLIYLLIGLIGVPVFSGFTGGVGKLFGPTGGYLIGFLFMAFIIGFAVDKFQRKKMYFVIGMVLGSIVTYVFGTIWLGYQTGMEFKQALLAGVIPFIPGDIAKIIIAAITAPMIKKRINF